MPTQFDPFSPNLKQDPYSIYKYFRQHDPVHWGKPIAPKLMGTWYLFRYEDVVSFLNSPLFARASSKSQKSIEVDSASALRKRWLFSLDPPEHSQIRSLIAPAFKAKSVENYRSHISKRITEIITSLPPPVQIDFVKDFAFPITTRIIADLLGIAEADLSQFQIWSKTIADGIALQNDLQALTKADEATKQLATYFRKMIKERGTIDTELLPEKAKNFLTEEDLIAHLVQFIFAGIESTSNLISNSLWCLLRFPEQQKLLQQNPELIPQAVEEFLRFESPTQTTAARTCLEKVTIGDREILPGQKVIAILGSANRDEKVFVNSEQLDITRKINPHIAFGQGIHFCLGIHLSRLEVQQVYKQLFQSYASITLIPSSLSWRSNWVIRGLHSLPIRLN
ncbi:MAG: cytochrome P450 [Cyanobacteria bacterium P01_H01_bin.35]